MAKAAAIETGKLFGRASLLLGQQPDAAGDLMERAIASMDALPADALLAMISGLVDWLQPKAEHPEGAQVINDLTNAAASGDAGVMREAIERLLRIATEGGHTQ